MKRILLTGTLLASLVYLSQAAAGGVCLSTGGGGGSDPCGDLTIPPSPTYTPPLFTVDFTGSVDYDEVSIGDVVEDHVSGFAGAVTDTTSYFVMSVPTQGIVLVPYDEDGNPLDGAVSTLSTGAASGPSGVVVADLNGDGQDDIIAVNGDDDSLSVFYGNSDGSFSAPQLVSLASKPRFFTLGDVDGDGNLDLLLPDGSAGTLDIYLNDGHGGFAAPVTAAAGAHPISIGAGDLDGDGDLDLVIGDGGDDSLSVLLNDGHGGFSLTSYAAGTHPDYLWLSYDGYDPYSIWVYDAAYDAGSVLAGNGDGSFQTAEVLDMSGGSAGCGPDCMMSATGGTPTATGGSINVTKVHKDPRTGDVHVTATQGASGSSGGGALDLLSLVLLAAFGRHRRIR